MSMFGSDVRHAADSHRIGGEEWTGPDAGPEKSVLASCHQTPAGQPRRRMRKFATADCSDMGDWRHHRGYFADMISRLRTVITKRDPPVRR
jgi:hypothetical protein